MCRTFGWEKLKYKKKFFDNNISWANIIIYKKVRLIKMRLRLIKVQ